MSDIVDDLRDLYVQATTDRSHYYVAYTTFRALNEIELLRKAHISALAAVTDAERRVVAEREACAKIAEKWMSDDNPVADVAVTIADEIRDRGES
jgi:hypothetical protein